MKSKIATAVRARWRCLPAVAAAGLLSVGGVGAAINQVDIDEGGFDGWALGQSASQLLEPPDANQPAARFSVGGTFDPTFAAGLRPESALESMLIAGTVSFQVAGPVAVNSVAQRNFNIFEPTTEGGGLSDTLSVFFIGLPGNRVQVFFSFSSDSIEGGDLAPFPGGFALVETGRNDSLNALSPGWLPGAADGFNITPAEFDIQYRSDVLVPEPSALGFSVLTLGLVAARRFRASRA
jgi:hypothetical protein